MDILLVIQSVVGIVLIALILMQSQGTGLGKSFGGSAMAYHSKKGLEKGVFGATIAAGLIFVLLALVNVLA